MGASVSHETEEASANRTHPASGKRSVNLARRFGEGRGGDRLFRFAGATLIGSFSFRLPLLPPPSAISRLSSVSASSSLDSLLLILAASLLVPIASTAFKPPSSLSESSSRLRLRFFPTPFLRRARSAPLIPARPPRAHPGSFRLFDGPAIPSPPSESESETARPRRGEEAEVSESEESEIATALRFAAGKSS